MFDDGFGTDDAIKAAALLALVGGGGAAGAKAFRRFVPTYGGMSIEALRRLGGVQNPKAVRKQLIEGARQLNERYGANPNSVANKAAESELLESLGLISSPRALDSAVYNEDVTRTRTINELKDNAEFVEPLGANNELAGYDFPSSLVSDIEDIDGTDLQVLRQQEPDMSQFNAVNLGRDFRAYDVVKRPGSALLVAVDDVKPLRDKATYFYNKGQVSRPTALRRLDQAITNQQLPADRRQAQEVLAQKIKTVGFDPNDAASVQGVVDNLVETVTRNMQVRQLLGSARQREAAGSQLSYLRGARKAANVRTDIARHLNKYADELVDRYAKIGGTLDKDVAYSRVLEAFAALSPKAKIETNWKRLRTAMDTLVEADDTFSDVRTLLRPDLDEWIRTPAGREWKQNFENQTIKAGQRALLGEETAASAALSELTKVGLTRDVIGGNVQSGIVDSDVIEDAIFTSPLFRALDARQRSDIKSAVFNNPNIYKAVVKGVNDSLSKGPLADVAPFLRRKKTGISGLQTALQGRKAGEATP